MDCGSPKPAAMVVEDETENGDLMRQGSSLPDLGSFMGMVYAQTMMEETLDMTRRLGNNLGHESGLREESLRQSRSTRPPSSRREQNRKDRTVDGLAAGCKITRLAAVKIASTTRKTAPFTPFKATNGPPTPLVSHKLELSLKSTRSQTSKSPVPKLPSSAFLRSATPRSEPVSSPRSRTPTVFKPFIFETERRTTFRTTVKKMLDQKRSLSESHHRLPHNETYPKPRSPTRLPGQWTSEPFRSRPRLQSWHAGQTTEPKPFNLIGVVKQREYEERLALELEKERRKDRENHVYRAVRGPAPFKPAPYKPVVTSRSTSPKPADPKLLTKPRPFEFYSDMRHEEYLTKRLPEKQRRQKQKQKQADQLARDKAEKDAQEIKAMRKTMIVRANPVPDFSIFEEPVTPKTPPTTTKPFFFHTEARQSSKCGRLP